MPQVFGCPNCQNPFQVPDDAAGQAFQCPTCEATVEVPAAEEHAAVLDVREPDSVPDDADIFSCPHCDGQFGVDGSMYGQNIACPHCEELVAVGEMPNNVVPAPEINTDSSSARAVEDEIAFQEINSGPKGAALPHAAVEAERAVQDDDPDFDSESGKPEPEPLAPPEPVFEPLPVDHLLPPRFDVPDPKRFPGRIGSDEVILPDGDGGYQSVDANIVTINHNGQIYQLKRLTPEERRRRKVIHNTVMIGVAMVLIYFTLRTLGVLS